MFDLPLSSLIRNRRSLPTRFRVDVFVCAFVFSQGINVKPRFMSECAFSDIWHIRYRRQIADFEDKSRYLGKRLDFFRCQDVESHFESQIRNNRAQVGVAAAFAESVDCSLHLSCAGVDCREVTCDCAVAVIVGVDADGKRALTGRRRFCNSHKYRSAYVPPLVSQSAIASAPASATARSTFIAYSGFSL